jgi:hypothetical protein
MTSYGDQPPPAGGPRPGPAGPVAPGPAAPSPRGASYGGPVYGGPAYGGPAYGDPAYGDPAYRVPAPAGAAGLMSAHRPGIIALRPLSLGDILDGAVKAVRHNPGAMIGLALLVNAVFLIPSALLSVLIGTRLADGVPADSAAASLTSLPASISVAVFSQLATLVLTGLLVHAVGEAVLGRKPSIGEVWRAARDRLPAVIGVNLLVGAATLVGAALLLTPGAVLLAQRHVASGISLLVLAALVVVVGACWVTVRTCMAGPAIVLERQTVPAALRRSFALTRGAFWRTFGILLLAGVIAWLVSSLISAPIGIAAVVAVAGAGLDGDTSATGLSVLTVLNHVGSLLAGAVTTPFVAAVTCLLYLDRRMRVEALDVVLVRAAQTDAAGRG